MIYNFNRKSQKAPMSCHFIPEIMIYRQIIKSNQLLSMVKLDMLYQLNLRLQEITGNLKVPFVGLFIFNFGDMMQLKLCLAHYIFVEPSNPEF